MTTLFLDTAAATGTNAWRSSCEVGRAVGPCSGCRTRSWSRWTTSMSAGTDTGYRGSPAKPTSHCRPGSCTSPSRRCWRTPRAACPVPWRRSAGARAVTSTLTNQQIAGELTLSARTVGNHLAHIYDKIGRRTRAGAAVYAIEAGLLPAEAGETRRRR